MLALRGIDGVEAHERAMDALAIVGLVDHAGRAVDRLSAGERERVALARAIAGRACACSSPTSRPRGSTARRRSRSAGSSPTSRREHGTTVICATHDPLLVTLAGAELPLRRVAAVAEYASPPRWPARRDTLHVTGIRCERCVMRLATALEGQPGLEAANANLRATVTLTWDDEVTSREALVGALATAGFHERPPV